MPGGEAHLRLADRRAQVRGLERLEHDVLADSDDVEVGARDREAGRDDRGAA
jgi:hypothetical protein